MLTGCEQLKITHHSSFELELTDKEGGEHAIHIIQNYYHQCCFITVVIIIGSNTVNG